MNGIKGMDRETIEEVIFGASHFTKNNRYMKMLKDYMLGPGCGPVYFRHTYQPLNAWPSRRYAFHRGGPP